MVQQLPLPAAHLEAVFSQTYVLSEQDLPMVINVVLAVVDMGSGRTALPPHIKCHSVEVTGVGNSKRGAGRFHSVSAGSPFPANTWLRCVLPK